MPNVVLILIVVFTFGCRTTDALISVTDETKISEESDETTKQVRIGGIDWYVDYDAALKVAKNKKLPIWLHFGENPG